MKQRYTSIHVLGFLAVRWAVGYAYAQSADVAGQPQVEILQEVVVTGEKRQETVAETPATVNVVSAQAISELGLNDLQSLNRVLPGFQFEMGNGGNMTLSIRGIGTTSSAQSFEQSVSPYVDGVYLGGNNRDFSWPLFDLERIEVYKGTQSGISGQNTSVGFIDIVTKQPARHFGGYLTVGREFVNRGNHAEGAVDIPVSSTFRMRIAGYYNDRGGWIHNVITGHDLGEQQMAAARITAVWDVSDNVVMHLYGEYDHERQIGSGTLEIDEDPTGGYSAYIAPNLKWSPNLGKTAMLLVNPDPGLGVTFGGDSGVLAHTVKGSARLDAKLGGGLTLTSVTVASMIDDQLSVDQDSSPAANPTATAPATAQVLLQSSNYHQVTEDLRLASDQAAAFSYLLGVWYRHASYEKTTGIFVWSPAAHQDIMWPFSETTNNKSVYGDVTYKVTSKVTLGGTLRYTNEVKPSQVQGLGNFPAVFPPFPPYRIDVRDSFFDGSARLQYQPEERVNLYAAYSHGTKTGALVDLVASGLPQVVKPEISQTYEIGSKLTVLSSLGLNLSVFRMNIANYQDSFAEAVNGTTLFVASNTNEYTNGVDATLQWYPGDQLSIGGSVEYLDAHDQSNGGTFVRSPKWQLNANARYMFQPFAQGWRAAPFVNVMYKDSYFYYPNGNPNRLPGETPAYAMVDFGVDVVHKSGVKISLLCKNCTDTFAHVHLTNGSFGPAKALAYYDYTPETRTVTLQGSYEF